MLILLPSFSFSFIFHNTTEDLPIAAIIIILTAITDGLAFCSFKVCVLIVETRKVVKQAF